MSRENTTNRTFKFSHRAIESLPAPGPDALSTNVEYTDAVESGLRIAVYKSGRRSFRHRYTYLGVKKMMTLGEFPAVNLEKARERVRANKAMLAEDLDPLEARQQQREAVTFKEFVEQDYQSFAKKERRSYRDIENRIKLRLIPSFGNKQMPRITKREVSAFHLKLRDEISAISANRYLALTSSIFSRAMDLGLITENPCRGIPKFREGGGRKRVLSGDELGCFVKILQAEMKNPCGQAVFLLLATGLRKSEVLSLRWSHVDLNGNRVFLPNTKSGVPRYAPLNSQAMGILKVMLENRKSENDWVFPSNSKAGHLLDVRRTFKSIMDRAELSNLRIHDLRRSFASLLINAGVPIYEVRDLLGHADIRTTQIYAHLGTSTLQAASEEAAKELEKALNPVH